MSEQKFLSVEISKYALLNPDRSSGSVPLNAHFEIIIHRASTGPAAERTPGEGPEPEAKSAPFIMLSGLASGDYPLFASSAEAESFAESLILDSPLWNKSYLPDSGAVRLAYSGGPKTLSPNFVLRVCSDAFNSTAEYKGKSVVQVSSKHFSLQFEDAFDDSYQIAAAQLYVPKITAFAPQGLPSAAGKTSEYEAALGADITLGWTILGDSLKSPQLVENEGPPETVSPDTPVKRVLRRPAAFRLTVESNAVAGLSDSRSLLIGISTPPSIDSFQRQSYFCLPGQETELTYAVRNASGVSLSADGSKEPDIALTAPKGSVTVKPELCAESQRLVTYTLTARGFLKDRDIAVRKQTALFVSRWKQTEKKPSSVPAYTEADGIVRALSYRNNQYCFSGQAVWKSADGFAWEKLSDFPLPQGASACKPAAGIFSGNLYAAGASANKVVYLAKYNLVKGQWSGCTVFGPSLERAGGAFAFVSDDRMYYFCAEGGKIGCFNYSPKPFDCWGRVGYLGLPAAALDVDSLLREDKLLVGAACGDDRIYIYAVSKDLSSVSSPVCLEAASGWLRLVETNGRVYAVAEAGIFDAETGEQKDMMFEEHPRIICGIGGGFAAIGEDGNGWSFHG